MRSLKSTHSHAMTCIMIKTVNGAERINEGACAQQQGTPAQIPFRAVM